MTARAAGAAGKGRCAMRKGILAILAAGLGVGLNATALSAPADPEHGETLARHWCAACHIVADDQPRGGDTVPTFAAIAAKPGFDAAHIASFLRDPHPKMPDMQLSTVEAADLAAYIASLKK
jgi:mono/diheme cytochrome c family protein